MNDVESLRKQIRFQLSQLGSENAHHEFEHLCRNLTRLRICSNIIPATGPVAAGGDQGRDFETFRSFLADNPVGDNGGFLGIMSPRPLAFACSLQQKDIAQKIRADVETIMESGELVEGVYFFSEKDLPVAARHVLQAWASGQHNIRLDIFDGKAISELLADADTYWIAVRYLGMPETSYPRKLAENDDWYGPDLEKWQQVENPHGFADFQELSVCARRALYDDKYRADLPFWIARLRVVAEDMSTALARHRTIAEIAALTIRGLKTFEGCDSLVRAYFEELDLFSDPMDYEGAAVTYGYSVGAFKHHVTSITPEELKKWRDKLVSLVDRDLACDGFEGKPNQYAHLLEVRGYIALVFDSVTEEQPNLDESLKYWNKLLSVVPDAPLYAITRFADHLTQFVTLFGDHPGFQELTARSDEFVASRHGGFAAASKARDRAMAYHKKGDVPRAIFELHRAKIKWFAKETLTGSVLAFQIISTWYREIGLAFAGKYYGFASAFMAVMADDADVIKRFPNGIALAAECEYTQGAWCGYLELAAVAETGAFQVLPATERDIPDAFKNLIFANSMVIAITERLVPERNTYVQEMTSTLELHDIVSVLLPHARKSVSGDKEVMRNRVTTQLLAPPFADLGATRIAAWAVYGTEWRVSWNNTYESTAVAEEFCAILQIFLADIHALDLHLLRTVIKIDIQVQGGVEPRLESVSSNTVRRWKATLPTNTTQEGFHDLQQRIFSFGATILWEISLLPERELAERIETLFQNGLTSKTTVVRPHSELFRSFTPEHSFAESRREDGPVPPDWHPRKNNALEWREGDGRSYDREHSLGRVRRRYENLFSSLSCILPRLRQSEATQRTVAELRSSGWKDWHILMAILNAMANFHINAKIKMGETPELAAKRYWKMLADSPEQLVYEEFPPETILTSERLREALQVSYLSTLKQLGLEVHQRTPDFPAIEDFLRHRYHYWDDDVEHEDPFGDQSDRKGYDGPCAAVDGKAGTTGSMSPPCEPA